MEDILVQLYVLRDCVHSDFSLSPHDMTASKLPNRVGPHVEKSSNLHITADSTGSIHKNARGKKFDPKKVRLGCGDLI